MAFAQGWHTQVVCVGGRHMCVEDAAGRAVSHTQVAGNERRDSPCERISASLCGVIQVEPAMEPNETPDERRPRAALQRRPSTAPATPPKATPSAVPAGPERRSGAAPRRRFNGARAARPGRSGVRRSLGMSRRGLAHSKGFLGEGGDNGEKGVLHPGPRKVRSTTHPARTAALPGWLGRGSLPCARAHAQALLCEGGWAGGPTPIRPIRTGVFGATAPRPPQIAARSVPLFCARWRKRTRLACMCELAWRSERRLRRKTPRWWHQSSSKSVPRTPVPVAAAETRHRLDARSMSSHMVAGHGKWMDPVLTMQSVAMT